MVGWANKRLKHTKALTNCTSKAKLSSYWERIWNWISPPWNRRWKRRWLYLLTESVALASSLKRRKSRLLRYCYFIRISFCIIPIVCFLSYYLVDTNWYCCRNYKEKKRQLFQVAPMRKDHLLMTRRTEKLSNSIIKASVLSQFFSRNCSISFKNYCYFLLLLVASNRSFSSVVISWASILTCFVMAMA